MSRVTYSPLLPIAPSDTHDSALSASPLSSSLIQRVSCLLHCPIDTPQLWPQVLSAVGSALSCEAAQLFLPRALSTSERYQWETHQNYQKATELSSEDAIALLWEYLGIEKPEINVLWQHQATDLQAQLAALAVDDSFRLSDIRLFPAIDGATSERVGTYPITLRKLFGSLSNRHLLLLPLCYSRQNPLCESSSTSAARNSHLAEQASTEALAHHIQPPECLGVLALLREATQPTWTSDELLTVESVGSQVYLAMRRAHLEQVSRNRSAYDQLTQLPDRMLFTQQLNRSIAMTAEQNTMLGVAFLDLDRFKNINDTLGHEAGDGLLQQVAERLQNCLRGYDVVARWGGDEFTLLLFGLRSAEDVSNIAERLLQRLAAPFQVQEQELYVTASLGIALAPYDGEDGQTLLRNADAAMYQAKAKGRNNYQVYFEEINANARTQLNLETDLRKALDRNELFLCYQPQVELLTGRWIGLEALIRWQHPDLGLISPAKFIPIAEETGLIEPIGHWVLQAACAQYQQWRKKGFPDLRLAVNLSAHQFHRSHLVRSIMRILKASELDPKYLELEVTESAAMDDVNAAIETLKELSNAGMQIAMDDFGTGYSSLSVLKHFPLDTIKIDRSFVMDLVDSPSDAAIASTIIALAKGLNFKVLAEGIETPEQVTVLSEMGCDYAQGYWFSRPLSVQSIDNMLSEGTFADVAKLVGTD